MSRETAPNYKQHLCCYYCKYAHLLDTDDGRCTKHEFLFHGKEARGCVCDDYVRWRIPFTITDNAVENTEKFIAIFQAIQKKKEGEL